MSINFGLIGVGRMGKFFGNVLAFSVPGVKLVAVSDRAETTARDAAARFGAQDYYTDYRRLLDRADIDAVAIVTPTNTHPEVIQASAAAGKHIFTEKPLAQTLAECDQTVAAVRASGVKMQVGFMRRFDAAYVAAKKKIEEGAIGEPVLFRATSRDPYRTSLEFARRENSGGLILDMGVHDFDLARWLMGSEVAEVQSYGGCLVYPELKEVGDIDNALINMRFENETIGTIDLSRNAVYGYDIRTEILGSNGGLLIGTLQQTAALVMTKAGVTHDTVPYFMERFGAAYAEEIRAFANVLLEDGTPSVGAEDAREATRIGVAATRSLDENRAVQVSEIQ